MVYKERENTCTSGSHLVCLRDALCAFLFFLCTYPHAWNSPNWPQKPPEHHSSSSTSVTVLHTACSAGHIVLTQPLCGLRWARSRSPSFVVVVVISVGRPVAFVLRSSVYEYARKRTWFYNFCIAARSTEQKAKERERERKEGAEAEMKSGWFGGDMRIGQEQAAYDAVRSVGQHEQQSHTVDTRLK